MSNDASHPKAPKAPWHAAHAAACERGADSYIDPRTGYQVFTRLGLEARGECCGAGCRHCPFGHERVGAEQKAARIQQPAFLHRPEAPPKAGDANEVSARDVVFWSSGKDSFLALRAWLRDATTRGLSFEQARARVVLVTSFDAGSRIIAHQDVPIALVQRQAQALGLPLIGIPLHPGDDYVGRVRAALGLLDATQARAENFVFGDLHLEHIRQWRDEALSDLGATLRYPLWGQAPELLLADLKASGVLCVVSACPGTGEASGTLRPIAVGQPFDASLVAAARKAGWDPFGENGEFHTLAQVWDAGADPLR